jgi:hypothetical protein
VNTWQKSQSLLHWDADSLSNTGWSGMRIVRLYVRLCAFVLFFSAALKLLAVTHYTRLLYELDPIFGVSNMSLFIGIGTLELVLCILLVSLKSLGFRLLLLVTISGCFAVYRLLVLAADFHGFCPCLGDPLHWWPSLARHQATLANLFFYCLMLSWLMPIALYRGTRHK